MQSTTLILILMAFHLCEVYTQMLTPNIENIPAIMEKPPLTSDEIIKKIKALESSNSVICMFVTMKNIPSFPESIVCNFFIVNSGDDYLKESWDEFNQQARNFVTTMNNTINRIEKDPEFLRKDQCNGHLNMTIEICEFLESIDPTIVLIFPKYNITKKSLFHKYVYVYYARLYAYKLARLNLSRFEDLEDCNTFKNIMNVNTERRWASTNKKYQNPNFCEPYISTSTTEISTTSLPESKSTIWIKIVSIAFLILIGLIILITMCYKCL